MYPFVVCTADCEKIRSFQIVLYYISKSGSLLFQTDNLQTNKGIILQSVDRFSLIQISITNFLYNVNNRCTIKRQNFPVIGSENP